MTNITKSLLLPEGFDLKAFLEVHENKNFESPEMIMRLRKNYGDKTPFLIEQLKLYNKVKVKLPFHSINNCLFTSKSFEQSSSEILAEFKQKRFAGNSLLDLTGGLGIDDWAFSKSFKKVESVDIDTHLNEIVRYNFKQIGIVNVKRINADAYDFVKQDLHYDMVYVDSDRRAKQINKKNVTIHDSEPSILKLQNRLFEISDSVLLKLSPLADITYLCRTLINIKKIFVVSLYNEVKEILVHLHKLWEGKIETIAIDINKNGAETVFTSGLPGSYSDEYNSEGKYFYEPANALIKSGLAADYAGVNGIMTIAKNSVYMLNNNFIKDFFGRKFEVVAKVSFGKAEIKKYLTLFSISRANVSKRNFPLNPGEIIKLFSLVNGGYDYLFFTTDSGKQKWMFHCKKIK